MLGLKFRPYGELFESWKLLSPIFVEFYLDFIKTSIDYLHLIFFCLFFNNQIICSFFFYNFMHQAAVQCNNSYVCSSAMQCILFAL